MEAVDHHHDLPDAQVEEEEEVVVAEPVSLTNIETMLRNARAFHELSPAEEKRWCNAPDPMRQVSASYSPSLPCHVLACCIFPCHHLHFISCHHVHRIGIRVHLMHLSIFPVVRFAIRHSYVLRRPPCVSCCERVLNILGID